MAEFKLTEKGIATLDRIVRKVDQLRGDGVKNTPESIVISQGKAGRSLAPSTDETCTVKITGNASGGGKYTGRVWKDPTSDISASGNLSASDLGTDPGSDNALILNGQELGQATHDLTAGTPVVTHFPGRILRTNSDGKFVVLINGTDWLNCT